MKRASAEGLERIIKDLPFFAGVGDDVCTVLCGCAKNVRFNAGEYLFNEGEPADQLYLIRHGRVALALSAPGRRTITFTTVGDGEIVGVSWLIPPYRWTYDAKALERTRAIAMDAQCLRVKCESDHDLGYDMMKRFMPPLVARLEAMRLQMLDVYGIHD